jgi:hypothetical protein
MLIGFASIRHFVVDVARQKWNEYSKNSRQGIFVLKMERAAEEKFPSNGMIPVKKMGAAGRRFCGGKK